MTPIKNDFLSILESLPVSCVYALISDSNMKCFISHSANLSARLGAVYREVKVKLGDDCRLVILDVLDDLEYKLLFCERYKHELAICGYDILNDRPYINYRAVISISRAWDRVEVALKNVRGDRTIVGIFSLVSDAEEFVKEYYSGELLVPVYANNEETREYINVRRTRNPRLA